MTALVSVGTLFKIGDGATPTEVFATIAQVQEIKWSGLSKKILDIPVLGQTYPMRKITSDDPQNVELKLLFDPAIAPHESFRTLLAAGTERNFQIILPDSSAYQIAFGAFVTKFELDAFTGEGSEIVANVTLELTAAATITP
jgi:hypothetical protein